MEEKIIHKELSYKIVGIAFDVYNALGVGYQEKYYQRGFAEGLRTSGLEFSKEAYIPIRFKEESIGHYYLDFLVDNKIIVELKRVTTLAELTLNRLTVILKQQICN